MKLQGLISVLKEEQNSLEGEDADRVEVLNTLEDFQKNLKDVHVASEQREGTLTVTLTQVTKELTHQRATVESDLKNLANQVK